jgi:hypothetical protein
VEKMINKIRKEMIEFLIKISAGRYNKDYFKNWSNKDLADTIISKLEIYMS